VRRRPLEHHVLEVVGQPGGPDPLVARAHAVPDLEARDRAPVVLLEEDAEAVVERGVDDLLGASRRAGEKQQRRDADSGGAAAESIHGTSRQWPWNPAPAARRLARDAPTRVSRKSTSVTFRVGGTLPARADGRLALDPRRNHMLASSKRSEIQPDRARRAR